MAYGIGASSASRYRVKRRRTAIISSNLTSSKSALSRPAPHAILRQKDAASVARWLSACRGRRPAAASRRRPQGPWHYRRRRIHACDAHRETRRVSLVSAGGNNARAHRLASTSSLPASAAKALSALGRALAREADLAEICKRKWGAI